MTDDAHPGAAAAERIAALLTARGIPFRVHEHHVSRTVADALETLPFPPEQLLKAIVFRVKDGPWVLAALRGLDRVNYKMLADALAVRRADISRPDPAEVEAALGYAMGGVCPIPPNDATRTIVDARAASDLDTVFCGIGRDDRTLEIALADLIAVSGALVAPIAQETESVA